MKRPLLAALFAALLVTLFATTAAAQDLSYMSHATAGPIGPHASGLMLRGTLGVGSTAMGTNDIYDTRIYGATADYSLALGAIIVPNVALHGTLWGFSAPSPEMRQDVGSFTMTTTQTDRELNMTAFGAGATVFLPSNFYLTASAGPAVLTTEVPDINLVVERDYGFAAEAAIGKEWFIGRNVGIGLAAGIGGFAVGANDYDAYDGFGGWHGSLRLSMTLN